MVLHVDINHLAEESKRHGMKPWVYLAQSNSKVVATIGDAHNQLLLQAETLATLDEAKKSLAEQGLLVAMGRWLPDPLAGELQIQEQIWMAAIAYKSQEEKPGLWVHGYEGSPSVGDVLKDFYEEMSRETDLSSVSLDDLVELAVPNVIILGPNELASFAHSYRSEC